MQIVAEALAQRADTVKAVIEVGAGTGKLLAQLAARFPNMHFTGVDIAPAMVNYATEKYLLDNTRYMLADVADGAVLPTSQFVYSVDVIHHIHNPLRCFQVVRQALRPGDVWLALEPNIFNPAVFVGQERMRRAGFDEDHLRPWVIEPLARAAGFAVAERRYVFMFPSHLRQLPPALRQIERICERFPLCGGNVVHLFVAR